MRKLSASALLCLSSVLCLPSALHAQVPQLINYQGRLLSGTNLVNGNVNLTLQLFHVPTGGAPLYEDTNVVSVVDGLYSTFIGDQTNYGNFATALAADEVWLQVVVNDAALVPRERLASVAFAVMAAGVPAGTITSAMLADGSVTSNKLAAGAVTTAALADGAVSGAKIANNAVASASVADGSLLVSDLYREMRAKMLVAVTNPTPFSNEAFGFAVAGLGADRFVVGAPFDSLSGNGAGCAYLYNAAGVLLVTVTNPAPESGDHFGWAVTSIGTNFFVVGSPDDNAGANNAGSAYLYSSDGVLVATITNPAPVINDLFGYSVAGVGSNLFVVGAYLDDSGLADVGSICVYKTSGARLAGPIFGNQAQSLFGLSVAGVGSDLIAVGDPWNDFNATDGGFATLRSTNGTLWANLFPPSAASNDYFGVCVAGVGSNLVAVAATGKDAGATDAGIVYLFNTNGNLLVTITNPAPDIGDGFGNSLAAVGENLMLIGALSDDAGATDAGVAYLYDLGGILQAVVTNPTPVVNEGFGKSVASVGPGLFVVGAYNDSPAGLPVGGAYLYSTPAGAVVPGLMAASVDNGAVGVNQLNTGEVDARYVRKTGDTMTGPLYLMASATNANTGLSLLDASGTARGIVALPGNVLNYSTDAQVNDVVIRAEAGGKLLLQSGDAGSDIAVATNHNVGIGTAIPVEKLEVAGAVRAQGYISRSGSSGSYGSNRINLFWTNSTLHAWVDVTDLGAITFTSDRRLKEGIAPMADDSLARVMALKPATFKYRNISGTIFTGDGETKEGFIADELQQVIPSAVSGAPDAVTSDGTIQPQTVNAIPVVSVLTKAVQEQQQHIKTLEHTILELRARLDALEKK